MNFPNGSACAHCGAKLARRYQLVSFDPTDQSYLAAEILLCVRCARTERKLRLAEPEFAPGLTRKELITELDRFFAASGVFDICAGCHQQGTGCCPPTCRVMGAAGCDPKNKFGKTVFCATFICSALLNAISECDPEVGRTLRWVKRELGEAEFHIYEMITRVPAEAREPVIPLALPRRYPKLPNLNGQAIKEKLLALTEEVLELRRIWREQEQSDSAAARLKADQSE